MICRLLYSMQAQWEAKYGSGSAYEERLLQWLYEEQKFTLKEKLFRVELIEPNPACVGSYGPDGPETLYFQNEPSLEWTYFRPPDYRTMSDTLNSYPLYVAPESGYSSMGLIGKLEKEHPGFVKKRGVVVSWEDVDPLRSCQSKFSDMLAKSIAKRMLKLYNDGRADGLA